MILTIRHKSPPSISPKEFGPVQLLKKETLTHDTRRLTFKLRSVGEILDLPPGSHISFKYTELDGSGDVIRSYTPVECRPGELIFIIKVYFPCEKFPLGGKMSFFLDNLEVGDCVWMKGPKSTMTYNGKGAFTIHKTLKKPAEDRSCRRLGIICGGTGITPVLQVIRKELLTGPMGTAPSSGMEISLLYANVSEEDIILKDDLDALAKRFPNNFKVFYTVDKLKNMTGDKWNGFTGFITEEMLRKTMPINQGADDVQYFMCGPPPMIKFACLPNLEKMGVTDKNWFVF